MLQCAKSHLHCAAQYGTIITVRGLADPPSAPRAHSSILLLWWNPQRGLKRPRFFYPGRGGLETRGRATRCALASVALTESGQKSTITGFANCIAPNTMKTYSAKA